MDPLQVDRPIKDIILEKLAEVEKKHQIKILHACEVGSRAWGLANATSDYDVKFIYVRRLNFYFSIEDGRRDIIDENSEFDMNGWDLRKALQLLRESNCSVLEWIYSEHAYKSEQTFLTKMSALAVKCHCRARLLLAYWGKASKHYREYIQVEAGDGTVPLKKYLFIVQSLLSAHWVLAFALEETHLPPQDFPTLLSSFRRSTPEEPFAEDKFAALRGEIIDIVNDLVTRKKAGTLKNGPRIKELDAWIATAATELEVLVKRKERKAPVEPKTFNDLLVDMVTDANGYRLVPEESHFTSLENTDAT